MNYLRKLDQSLPSGLKVAQMRPYAAEALWKTAPKLALSCALAASGKFDVAAYLSRYQDIKEACVDPIWHFVWHGADEGRCAPVQDSNVNLAEAAQADDVAAVLPVTQEMPAPREYAAIIALDELPRNLIEQYRALKGQSLKPAAVIYVIDGAKLDERLLRELTGHGVQIIDGGKAFWCVALALAAECPYAALLMPEAVPGMFWMANAMRAHGDYGSLVVARGWLTMSEQPGQASNSGSDAFCAWGDGILFLEGRLAANLANSAGKSFDALEAMRIANIAYAEYGIGCVAPMRPEWDARFAVTGIGAPALPSVASLPAYKPITRRRNQARIHLIVVFGKRDWLERCLLSIKAQIYDNYTVTVVDDCCDGQSAQELLDRMQLDARFRCICRTKRKFRLAGYEDGTDTLDAGPADIVAYVDGDDWLNHPHVLAHLNILYGNPDVLASYGNMVRLNAYGNDFSIYGISYMTRQWNMAQNRPGDATYPFRRLSEAELKHGWACAPWSALHLRSFRLSRYLLLNRLSFRSWNGVTNRVATDASIFVPLLNECGYSAASFMPDPGYTYQYRNNINIKNTKASLNAIYRYTRKRIAQAQDSPDIQRLGITLAQVKAQKPKTFKHQPHCAEAHGSSAVITVITPNFIVEGLLAVTSYLRNLDSACDALIFIATRDEYIMASLSAIAPKHVRLLFPASLSHMQVQAEALEKKYGLGTDAYRWSMKGVVLQELLTNGYDMALFLDPDIYVVSGITDLHEKLFRPAISVFPHFRNPDEEYSRRVLYKDGFFNGGMLAANREGLPHLRKLFERCYRVMEKSKEKYLYVDQKYHEDFLFEVDSLFINLDRGINYNTWNSDPVEGFVGISQRSYLLKDGAFARIWHVSSDLVKYSGTGVANIHRFTPLVVAIYTLARMQSLLLLLLKAMGADATKIIASAGLNDRFQSYCAVLDRLAPGIDQGRIKAKFEWLKAGNSADSDTELQDWTDMVLDSICFDNLELYAELLENLFSGSQVERYARRLREQDLRYQAEAVIPDSRQNESGYGSQERSAGDILQTQINRLAASGVRFE